MLGSYFPPHRIISNIDRTELYVCDELFYVGTGWEILPITKIDGLVIGDGNMGPVARQFDRMYHDVVRGMNNKYMHWCTLVYQSRFVSNP